MGSFGFVFGLFVTHLIIYGNARSVAQPLFKPIEAAVVKKATMLDHGPFDWFGAKGPAYKDPLIGINLVKEHRMDDIIPDPHMEQIERSNNILKSGWMMVETMEREASRNNPDPFKVLQLSGVMEEFNAVSEFADSIFYSQLDRLIPPIDVCPGDKMFVSFDTEIQLKLDCFISITSKMLEKLEYFNNNKYSNMITLEDIGTMVSLDKKWITVNDQLYNLINENQTKDCDKAHNQPIDLLDTYLKNNPIKSYHNILHQNTAPQNEINHYHHFVPNSHHGSRGHLRRKFHHMLDFAHHRHGNYKQKYSTDYKHYGQGHNSFKPAHDAHGYSRGYKYDSANHDYDYGQEISSNDPEYNDYGSGSTSNHNYWHAKHGLRTTNNSPHTGNGQQYGINKSKGQGYRSSSRHNKNNVYRSANFRGNNYKITTTPSFLNQYNDKWNHRGRFDPPGYNNDDTLHGGDDYDTKNYNNYDNDYNENKNGYAYDTGNKNNYNDGYDNYGNDNGDSDTADENDDENQSKYYNNNRDYEQHPN